MDLLNDAKREAERLLVAGGALAKDDFRVKRLLPALEEAASSAPVLGRLALALGRAIGEGSGGVEDGGTVSGNPVEAPAEAAAAALMEARALLGAIAATRARAGVKGDFAPFAGGPRAAPPPGGQASYWRQGPVAEALGRSGPGRLAVLEEAEKEGLLRDFRILPALVAALGDGSPDIAALSSRALAAFGPAAVPLLREAFDPTGGAAEARRLELLVGARAFMDEELLSLARAEDREVSGPVRAAAIEALSEGGAGEEVFLPLAKDRKKEVRVGAAAALCRFSTEAAAAATAEVAAKDADPKLLSSMRNSASPLLATMLLDRARGEYEAALPGLRAGKGDPKAVDRCLASLSPLPVVEPSPVLDFLLRACDELDSLGAGTARDSLLGQCLARLLSTERGPRQRLLTMRATEAPERLAYRLYASLLSESPSDCYSRFSSLLGKGRKDPRGASLIEAWRSMWGWYDMAKYGLPGFSGVAAYDTRWRDEFCRLDEVELVCRFDPAGMPKAVQRYLEKKAEDPLSCEASIHAVLAALAGAGSGRLVELCLRAYDRSKTTGSGRAAYGLRSAAESVLLSLDVKGADELSRIAAREKDGDRASFLGEMTARLRAKTGKKA